VMEDPWYGIATDYDTALGRAPYSPWTPSPDDDSASPALRGAR
jgi:hypothetical protein